MKRPDPVNRFKKILKGRRKPSIQEVVREATAGGIVYRVHPKNGIEVLLIQDAKERWTIPKGHIESGETAKEAARREIEEETGLSELTVLNWLGKINFRYRRQQSLILMTTQIYLVRAEGDTDKFEKEKWMNDIGWFKATDALDMIEYEDIGTLILLGMKKIRQMNGR